MKRILAVMLLVALVLTFAGCKGNLSGGEGYIGDKKSEFDENASENIAIDHAAGSLSMDEGVVKELLSAYPAKDLGLAEDVYDYIFKLEQVILNGKPCCQAKAFLTDPKKVEGIFYIVGTDCYRYDAENDVYYLLKTSGAKKAEVEVEPTKADSTTEQHSVSQKTEEDIQDENTKVLVARYKNYDLSVVGLPEPIDNYTFQATGKTAVASDGERVFIIYLMKDGQYTEFVFATGVNGKDYYYDSAADKYKPLS